ncbi:head GIN domain-containing protein [Pedobacter sp. KR3-3]|uniref:Head GIN domain-containing protein n=1 Tax=Pedobacter albus TaxID=3113905 RepID=A0ABU7ICJ2_9SPHI|nr:head GIN domain-containing protein [Pedobacter sp. KR3-3]MEE1947213.1 head GIN domain-containing protein [Pedobacter sp. KR3-3]
MKLTSIKKISLLLIATFGFGLSLAYAQSSRSVNVKSFDQLTVSSGIDMYLTQGGTESLTIKGNNDVIKDVVVEQNGSSVLIKYKDGINWGRLFKNQSIKVYVNYKNIKSLTSSGGSDVYTENTMKADQLNVRASGGSDVKLTLNCKDLTLSVSGGSDANLKGTAENMQLSASGGSDIDAFGFVVNNAKVNVSGGSDANIYVNKALEAGASGGSDIHYKGNASLKKTTSSKSGDITHVN